MHTTSYRVEFEAAIERTRLLGYPALSPAPNMAVKKVDEIYAPELMAALVHELGGAGGLHPQSIAFNCLHVSAAMQRHVKRVAGIDTWLTVGSVEGSQGMVWEVDTERPTAALQAGTFHSWLTTSALEILDFTLMVSLKLQQDASLATAQPIVGDPDTIGAFRWHPVVVGREVVAGHTGLGLKTSSSLNN